MVLSAFLHIKLTDSMQRLIQRSFLFISIDYDTAMAYDW